MGSWTMLGHRLPPARWFGVPRVPRRVGADARRHRATCNETPSTRAAAGWAHCARASQRLGTPRQTVRTRASTRWRKARTSLRDPANLLELTSFAVLVPLVQHAMAIQHALDARPSSEIRRPICVCNSRGDSRFVSAIREETPELPIRPVMLRRTVAAASSRSWRLEQHVKKDSVRMFCTVGARTHGGQDNRGHRHGSCECCSSLLARERVV